MSKITLQDNNLDAEIYLVSVDRETNESEYLPIDLSSINYFEIRDDLINFGLTGNITFPNWGELLSKLKLGMGSQIKNPGEQYIAIQVYDMDLPGEKFDNNGYRFLANAKSSASLMSNVVDVKQTLELEEDLTSLLKKISWEIFLLNNDITKIEAGGPITEILNNILTLATTNRFSVSDSLISRGTIGSSSYASGRASLQANVKIINFLESEISTAARDRNKSIYELVQNLYNHTVLEANESQLIRGSEPSKIILPLLKTKYIDSPAGEGGFNGPPERHIEFSDLLSPKHIEFIDSYKANVTGKEKDTMGRPYFSDVYMEEFGIAPVRSNSNSSIHNQIEDYNLIQPDINNLRQTIWGSYTYLDQQDVGIVNQTEIQTFNYFKAKFENAVLGGNKSNLPYIKKEEQKLFKRMPVAKPVGVDIVVEGHWLNKYKDLNTILKSFIYLNETIVFNVKGKMYRRPGKFITIKGDISPSRVEEIWYVTNVRHKFENGNYENEITAVRFLGNGSVLSPEEEKKLSLYKDELDSIGLTGFEDFVPVER
mgnify:CR=1 FL=1|tara:strand:+ start:1383 stop:3005 length:1623 start_codon:yes stop_codon:yes gene_type:complete